MSQLAPLQAANGLLAKSDGRDKFIATIQYVLMFLHGGKAGTLKDVQGNVAMARKVFRVMKPLEMVTPLIKQPGLAGEKPLYEELLPKLKSLCMAVYFGCDHLVWLGSVKVIKNKDVLQRCQKTSLWGWLLGSLCTITQLCIGAVDGALEVRNAGESAEEWAIRRADMMKQLQSRLLVLVHATVQERAYRQLGNSYFSPSLLSPALPRSDALLAAGLLQLWPFRPRTTATFGVLASALNCYMLMPPVTKSEVKSSTQKLAAKTA